MTLLYSLGLLFFLAALLIPAVRVVWCVALVLAVAGGVGFWWWARTYVTRAWGKR